ncbi:hypothetical protein T492DRAFT_837709 [Pavlovales sp. CCMP2436]|nr:hypothetical protein T492DRAFT_837709 [Pavlovales sp. CCMP2436]
MYKRAYDDPSNLPPEAATLSTRVAVTLLRARSLANSAGVRVRAPSDVSAFKSEIVGIFAGAPPFPPPPPRTAAKLAAAALPPLVAGVGAPGYRHRNLPPSPHLPPLTSSSSLECSRSGEGRELHLDNPSLLLLASLPPPPLAGVARRVGAALGRLLRAHSSPVTPITPSPVSTITSSHTPSAAAAAAAAAAAVALESAVTSRYTTDDPLFASVARRLEAAVRARALAATHASNSREKPRAGRTEGRNGKRAGKASNVAGKASNGESTAARSSSDTTPLSTSDSEEEEGDEREAAMHGGSGGPLGLDGVGFMAAEVDELWGGVQAISARNSRLYATHYNRIITQVVCQVIG